MIFVQSLTNSRLNTFTQKRKSSIALFSGCNYISRRSYVGTRSKTGNSVVPYLFDSCCFLKEKNKPACSQLVSGAFPQVTNIAHALFYVWSWELEHNLISAIPDNLAVNQVDEVDDDRHVDEREAAGDLF